VTLFLDTQGQLSYTFPMRVLGFVLGFIAAKLTIESPYPTHHQV
jgi:hypothetical protein